LDSGLNNKQNRKIRDIIEKLYSSQGSV